MSAITVLGVDGSLLVRDMLRQALADLPDVSLVDTAPNGKIGLDKLRLLRPDLVLLGAQLPDLPAPRFVSQALSANARLGILLLAHHDAAEADPVVQSLAAGALDFVIVPPAGSPEEVNEVMRRRLVPKLRALSTVVLSRLARALSGQPSEPGGGRSAHGEAPAEAAARAERALRTMTPRLGAGRYAVVVVGVSTGGPEALGRLVPLLPRSFPLPVVVVLHMPKAFTASLAAGLDVRAALRVQVPVNGETLAPGTVYLAEGGTHVRLERGAGGRLALETDEGPAVNGCKPSADVLFGSAADVPRLCAIGLILTGMGEDGVAGLRKLKDVGARILAQDRESSVVWGMPGRAVEAGVVDEVLPLDDLAERLCELAAQP